MAQNTKKTDSDEDGRPGEWAVVDTNAVVAERIHEPLIGKTVALSAHKKTYMPMAMAVRFLADSSFEVWNENGQRVHNMPDRMASVGSMPELRPGETIAHVEELTADALRARAARRPGGERLAKATRAELVDFLVNGDMKRGPAKGQDFDALGADDEADGSDFSKQLLEGQLDAVKGGAG